MRTVRCGGRKVQGLTLQDLSTCNRYVRTSAGEALVGQDVLGGAKVARRIMMPRKTQQQRVLEVLQSLSGDHAIPDEYIRRHREGKSLCGRAARAPRCRENKTHEWFISKRTGVPCIPLGLRLAPDSAHRVLADRAAEERCQRAAHPARIGSGKIAARYQRAATSVRR
jgi:hypothetical protein